MKLAIVWEIGFQEQQSNLELIGHYKTFTQQTNLVKGRSSGESIYLYKRISTYAYESMLLLISRYVPKGSLQKNASLIYLLLKLKNMIGTGVHQPTYCIACITIVTKTNARAPPFRLVQAGGRSGPWGGEGAKGGPTTACKQTSLHHPSHNHAT